MRRIKERAVRLRRYPRGKGFGVQSPNDYTFITKVIKIKQNNESCEAIDRKCVDVRGDNFRFAHLCYRVARYLKPAVCMCMTPPEENIKQYLQKAVHDVTFTEVFAPIAGRERNLLILPPSQLLAEGIELMLDSVTDGTWMIIDGIRNCNEMSRIWKNIVEDARARITFDVYHYGIVCFDKKRYKQNYKIYL